MSDQQQAPRRTVDVYLSSEPDMLVGQWMEGDLVGFLVEHGVSHLAAEKAAEALGIGGSAAVGISGFLVGLESDNPGALERDNVVYMSEVTVWGSPTDSDQSVSVYDIPDAPNVPESTVSVHDLPVAPIDVYDLPEAGGDPGFSGTPIDLGEVDDPGFLGAGQDSERDAPDSDAGRGEIDPGFNPDSDDGSQESDGGTGDPP